MQKQSLKAYHCLRTGFHKSKAEGLTSAERQEQALLRSEYLEAVRRNLKGQLDNIDIVNKDGSVENLGKKYEERYGKKGN